MFQPAMTRSVDPAGGKAGTAMHELAMRYLAQQRSEQLIGEAERHTLIAALRPALSARIGRRVAALFARAATGDGEARPGWFRSRVGSRCDPGPGMGRLGQPGR